MKKHIKKIITLVVAFAMVFSTVSFGKTLSLNASAMVFSVDYANYVYDYLLKYGQPEGDTRIVFDADYDSDIFSAYSVATSTQNDSLILFTCGYSFDDGTYAFCTMYYHIASYPRAGFYIAYFAESEDGEEVLLADGEANINPSDYHYGYLLFDDTNIYPGFNLDETGYTTL